ncbi:DedA family protein [Stigmatella sp. ncwal1]|uniref:DedA family protein n=1 Tax=Stigmatella ashevillensis TaxID=2995309 RepID=A0ABT5DCZ0_9BACT|nr:DedA family protein [Stigmatella ashevillena]MDC0711532.1 DedA family protein [Stigmatella ashevillena]
MDHGLPSLLLTHGSYALLFVLLMAGGVGLPLPEDIVLLTGGALAHLGVVKLPVVIGVCFAGVLSGDLLLFHTARKLGPGIYEKRWMKALLTPERRARIAALYTRFGGRVIFLGRYMFVLRVPIFAMAAVQGVKARTFLLWDALALSLSAPLLVGLGYLFSHSIDRVAAGLGHAEHMLAIAVVGLLAGVILVRTLRARRAG